MFTLRAFGRTGSFVCTWALVMGYITVPVFESVAIPTALEYLLPDVRLGLLWTIQGSDVYVSFVLTGVVSAVLMTAINYVGIKTAAIVQTLITALFALRLGDPRRSALLDPTAGTRSIARSLHQLVPGPVRSRAAGVTRGPSSGVEIWPPGPDLTRPAFTSAGSISRSTGVREVLVQMEPAHLFVAVVVKAGGEPGGVIEDTERDVGALGAWLEAEADARPAGRAETAPGAVARVVAGGLAEPAYSVDLERRESGDDGAEGLAAHAAVAVGNAPRRSARLETDRTAQTCAPDRHVQSRTPAMTSPVMRSSS